MKRYKKRKKINFKKRFKSFISKVKKKFSNEVEDELDLRSAFSIWEVIVIIFISILFGIVIGFIITYGRSPFGEESNNSRLSEVITTYNNILDNYYNNASEDKLADGAIKGMIESLDDPHSVYMDKSTTDSFNETVDGSFIGIGVTVLYEEHYNRIIEVNENGPADKAGLKVDDIILEVGGKSAEAICGDDLASLIRGKKGTNVEILVERNGKQKKFTVKRDVIEVESVISTDFKRDGKKIGYLNITSFAANTAEQFSKKLKSLEKKKIDSLIIDVRDNPGGHLSQAKEILSKFFDKKTVLYRMKTKNKDEKVYSNSNEKRDYPVVILANNSSASASEVLVACFKENYKNSLIVGEKTYGKGTVQKSKALADGTSIKYTTQSWLTSKGRSINDVGIEPDVEVSQVAEYYKVPNYENDKQLQEALIKIKEMK